MRSARRPAPHLAAVPKRWRATASPTALAVVAAALVVSAAPRAARAQEPAPAAPTAAARTTEARTVAEAARIAAAEGHRVEVTDLRDDASTTWVLPDGGMESELYAGPIRTRRGGHWVDVDTKLTRSGTQVRPRSGAADVALSGGGSTLPLVTLSRGGKSVSMLWPSRLPEPELDGDVATYRDVAPHTDVVVASRRTGFEQSVVLHERPTDPVVIRLPLRLAGLRAEQDAAGVVRFYDAHGERVVTMRPAVMWGSAVDARSGDPTHRRDVPTVLAQTPAGPELVVTPDPAFLADPAVTYPVTIDPDGDLGVTTDTWVESGVTTPQRYHNHLRVGTANGTDGSRSLIKFNTALISGTRVDSATLNLYQHQSGSCQARTLNVHRVFEDWDPDTAVWTNQPGTSSTVWGSASGAHGYDASCPAAWFRVPNLQGLFQLWADGSYPNHGLRLSASETDPLAWKSFYSANFGGNVVPSVRVLYTAKPSAPRNVTALSGNNAATVTWEAPATDGGSAITGYVVKRFTVDASGNILGSGTANVSATTFSYTSTAVSNGQRAYFEISATNAIGTGEAARSETVIVGSPTAPRRVDAVPGNGSVTVIWSAPAGDAGAPVTSYNVKRVSTGGTGTASVASTARLYTSTSPANGHTATMSVQACNVRGCGEWSAARQVTVVDSLALAGERGYFTYDTRNLTDKLDVKVNLSSGNLMVAMSDLSLPGATKDLGVGHTYNSLSQFGSTATTGSLGRGWRLSTGPDVRLAVQSDGSVIAYNSSGGADFYKKNADGSFTGPQSAKADLTGTGSGDSTYKLTAHGSGQILRFDANGNLTSDAERTDRTDTRVTFTNRTTTSHPQAITGTRGAAPAKTLTLAYNLTGTRLARIEQSGGNNQTRQVVFDVDAATDDLDSVTDAAGKVTAFEYNASHDLVKIVTPDQRVTTFEYDAVHRVTKMTRDPGGADEAVTTYDWTANSGKLKLTDPRQKTWTYEFDSQDRVTKVIDPEGDEKSRSFTPFNDVSSFTNAAGTTTLGYGANGGESLTSVAGPGGASSSYTYNQTSGLTKYLPASSTNAAGDQTTYSYDGPGNLSSSTDSGGAQAYVERNDDGTIAFTTDPEHKGDGHTPAADCTRDDNTVDNCTAYKYDDGDKQLTRILPPNNAGNLGTQTFDYDRFNRMDSVTVGGVTVTSTYDNLDRLVRRDYSDQRRSVVFEYYGDGLLKKRKWADETGSTIFTYDNLGRLKSKQYQGQPLLEYEYDDIGNLVKATEGARINSQNPARVTTYGYDSRNRLVRMTTAVGTSAQRVNLFRYDDDGNRTDTYYNTSGEFGDTAHFTAAGDLRTPEFFTAHVDATISKGDLTKIVTTRRSADSNVVASLSYDYTVPITGGTKNVGRRTKRTDNLTGVTTSYTYEHGRLTGANASSGTDYFYCYDGNGNRKWEGSAAPASCAGVTALHSFNAANQVTDTGWSYDAAGNATAVPGVGALGYEGLDFTVSVTPPGGSATSFEYTGVDQAERLSAGATTFVNGLTGLQSQETTAAVTYFDRDPDGQLVSMTTGSDEYYYAFDGLGSVVALIHATTGDVAGRYSYDPYGVTTVSAGEAANTTVANTNPWRYAGGYHDALSGLVKFGVRYYSPTHGRFTQPDPVVKPGNPARACTYAYVGNNPINVVDPTGADWSDFTDTLTGVATIDQGVTTEEMVSDCFIYGGVALVGGFILGGWVGAAVGFMVGCASATLDNLI